MLERIKNGFTVPDAEVMAAAKEFAEQVYGITGEEFDKRHAQFVTATDEGTKEASVKLGDNLKKGTDAAKTVAEDGAQEIAVEVTDGLANGIDNNADTVIEAAKRLAGYVSEAVQTVMMIKSPSKVMERLGEFVSQGFADGISGAAWRVDNAVTRMTGLASAPAIRQPMAVAAVGNGRAAVGAGYGNIQAIIMMDKTVVGEMVAPVVDGALQAQIEAVRR